MKVKFAAQVTLTTLAFGSLAFTAEALPPTVASPTAAPPKVAPARPTAPIVAPPAAAPVAQPSTVTFRCVQSGSGYATVVSNGVKQATLITWNSTSFGSNYTPETRCNTVSQRFQTITAKNGGKLSNLVLTAGAMGSQTVICAINQGKYGCNSENLLFTLNPENSKNPGAVLAALLQVGKYGSGSAVSETTELPEYNLEAIVNEKLSDAADAASPEPSAPSMIPTPAQSGDSAF